MVEWGPFGAKALKFITTPIEQDARITILEGSVRSSKTACMIPKWLDYIEHGPKGLLAMTGYSKQQLKINVLNDIFDTVGRNNYDYRENKGELSIYGRRLAVIGIKDEGSEKKLRGPTFAGAYSDETTLMPKSSFDQLLNRLSIENARLYCTTNPDSPYHYLNKDYITFKNKVKSGMVKSIHFQLDDNLSLSKEYKAFIKAAYSGLHYKRMILGLWVLADGAIYDMFDEERHCITLDELPGTFQRKMIGIDVGTANPTVYLKSGVTVYNGKPSIFHYDEYYHDGSEGKSKTTSEYKRDLVTFMGGRYEKKRDVWVLIEQPDAYELYIDPSALSFITELKSRSCGISLAKYIKRANNDVSAGINSVATFIDQGRYRIVKAKCPNTVQEKSAYMWDPKKQLIGEDAPLKTHDHGSDAERYTIHTAFPATKRIMSYALGTG